jgi:hypothetical protein
MLSRKLSFSVKNGQILLFIAALLTPRFISTIARLSIELKLHETRGVITRSRILRKINFT